MPKRVIEDDAEGSKDPPDVIAGRRRAIVSSRFRRKTLPASVQAPTPFARVQISSTSTGPAVEEKDGASGEASATKRIAFSQVVPPPSVTNSSESEGQRRKLVSPAPAPPKWSDGFSFSGTAPAPAPAKLSGEFSFSGTAPAPPSAPSTAPAPPSAPSMAPAPAPSIRSGGFYFPGPAPAPAAPSMAPAPAPSIQSGGFYFPGPAPAPAFPTPAPDPAKRSDGLSFLGPAPAPASAASNGFSFSVTSSAPAPVKESSIVGAEVKSTSTSLPVAANSGATGEMSAGKMNAFLKAAAPSSDFGSLSTGSKQRSTAVPADSVPSIREATGEVSAGKMNAFLKAAAPSSDFFSLSTGSKQRSTAVPADSVPSRRVDTALAPPAPLQTSSLFTETVGVNSMASNEASAHALSLGDSPWTVSDSSTAENNRVDASVPGGSAPSSTGFSSPPAALKRSEMKPLLEAPLPSSQPSAVYHPASSSFPMIESAAGLKNNSTSVETSTLPNAPFGDGLTAVKGVRLNKRFMSWISYQLDTAPECAFDAGLLDYVVHASEIRTQVAFSKADTVSKLGTAFHHTPPTVTLTYPRSSPPNPTPALPVSSTAVAQATPLSIEAAPAPAPKTAVAPAGSATTGFYFSAPSTLPTPSGTSTLFSSRAPKDPSEKQAPAPAAATTLPRAAPGTLFPSKAPQAPSGEEAPSPSVTSTLAPAPHGKLFSSKAPAPALNPTPKPASSAMPGFFPTPSALPPAPSGGKFSFKLPSAPAFTSTSAAPAVTALAESSSSSSSSPSLGFKFGAGLPGSGFQSTFTGFKVPGGAAAPPLSAGGIAGGAADNEEAEMPKDDPAQLERAPGEEDETVVRNFRAKLYIFKNDESTWADLGVGVLRLMEHKTDGTRRFILRNDMGKVLLNAGFYRGMKVTKMKNSISFLANMAEGGPKNVMLKVTANEIQDLHNTVLALLPTS